MSKLSQARDTYRRLSGEKGNDDGEVRLARKVLRKVRAKKRALARARARGEQQ